MLGTNLDPKKEIEDLPGNAGKYLILGGITMRGNNINYDFEERFVVDGEVQTLRTFRPKDVNNYRPDAYFYNATLDANPHVIATQFRRVATSGTAYVKNSDILALSLDEIPLYRAGIEHNSTITYSGILKSINVSVNSSSTTDDVYNMSIYNFANSNWNSTPCQNQSVASNAFYTIWCNVTENPTNYNSSDNKVRVRLNSTEDSDKGTLKEEYVQYYIGYIPLTLEYTARMPSGYTCPSDCFIATITENSTSDWISFNASSTTQNSIQPFRNGSATNDQNGNTKPIFFVENTGTFNINLLIRNYTSLPSGATLSFTSVCDGCTSSYDGIVTNSYQTVISNLPPGKTANISLWLNVVDVSFGVYPTGIYIKGESV
jgi:hypothetical protein